MPRLPLPPPAEVSPSTLYAAACVLEGVPFINGSPQNTFVPGLIDMAVQHNVLIGAWRGRWKALAAQPHLVSGCMCGIRASCNDEDAQQHALGFPALPARSALHPHPGPLRAHATVPPPHPTPSPGGDDFKSGQTKMKSVLVDFLVGAGIKPTSIVSYNHLGNNDGMNLSAPQVGGCIGRGAREAKDGMGRWAAACLHADEAERPVANPTCCAPKRLALSV